MESFAKRLRNGKTLLLLEVGFFNLCSLLGAVFPVCLSAEGFIEGSLMGQLGNQMFIIAAAYSLALDHQATAIFPDLVRSNEYNIPFNREKMFAHLNASQSPRAISHHYIEPFFEFSPIPYRPDMRIFGYFQSEKYFAHHKAEILALFAPSPDMKRYLLEKYETLLNHPMVVAVHLRSYLDIDPSQKLHITYGRDYIEKAMG